MRGAPDVNWTHCSGPEVVLVGGKRHSMARASRDVTLTTAVFCLEVKISSQNQVSSNKPMTIIFDFYDGSLDDIDLSFTISENFKRKITIYSSTV